MKNILFDLSGKIDQKIVDALSILKKAADSLNVPFFVIGAAARDFILENGFHRKSPRMTKDVDLGVRVASWEEFDQLRQTLLSQGGFTSTDTRYRFGFDSLYLDIIPFGDIAGTKRLISWPPEHGIIMNMMGFEEAFRSSTLIKLNSNPDLEIKVPTLPGLSLMKIISWQDRTYPERRKDAQDLLFIMQNYDEAGNFDRLYETEQALLEEASFDTRYAAIRLLGRDMAQIADPATFNTVKNILNGETDEPSQYNLVIDMMQASPIVENKFDEILAQTKILQIGFCEVKESPLS